MEGICMECELCGKEASCKKVEIDKVKMMVCQNCFKFGQGIEIKSPPFKSSVKKSFPKTRKPKEKDVYKEINKELVTNWNNLIKNAREKKGLSREDLGFKIGERTVTISKIENGDLRPSDKIIEKIEKELNITLLESISSQSTNLQSFHQRSSLTLGDFVKKEDE
jgi:putative transcription factor